MPNYSRGDSVMTSKRLVTHSFAKLKMLKQCQIVSTDDYMPMPISNLDEYNKVVNVSWFTPDKPPEELTFVFRSE